MLRVVAYLLVQALPVALLRPFLRRHQRRAARCL